MKLSDIIVSALNDLDANTDAQSIEAYSTRFTQYANDAVRIIAEKYAATRTETMSLTDGIFSIDDLERECIKIVSVQDETETDVDFYQKPYGSGSFFCDTEYTSVSVTYTYYPKLLTNTSDEPELPKFTHEYITLYVVARNRSGGDPDTQGAAAIHYQLFNSALSRMGKSSRGDPNSYKIINRW